MKKKILFVTSSYPLNNKDMTAVFVYKISEAMNKLGFDIDVVAPDYKGLRENNIGNINILPLKYFFSSLEILTPPNGGAANAIRKNPFLFLLLPFYYLFLVMRLLLIHKRYDGIFFFWFWNCLPLSIIKNIREKSVVAIYGSDFKFFMKNNLIKSIFIKTLKKYKAIITDNPYTQSLVPFSNLVFQGVDVLNIKKTNFKINNYIIFCGNLIKEKGIKDLLEIFVDINIDVHLVIAGNGPLKEYVEEYISDYDLNKRIHYIGSIAQENLLYLVKNALLLVLPSSHEGTPNVILESIALGTPFLAYDIPQLKCILNEHSNQFLVKKNDKNALKKRIEFLVSTKEARDEMKKIEMEWFENNNISWVNTAKKYLHFLFEKEMI